MDDGEALFIKGHDGVDQIQRTRDVLVELKLCALRQSCERPTLWQCPDCLKVIDRDPVHRGKWIACVHCGCSQFIDPELSLN